MPTSGLGWQFEEVVDDVLRERVPSEDERQTIGEALKRRMIENHEAEGGVSTVDLEAVRRAIPIVLDEIHRPLRLASEQQMTDDVVYLALNGLCSPRRRLPYPICPSGD